MIAVTKEKHNACGKVVKFLIFSWFSFGDAISDEMELLFPRNILPRYDFVKTANADVSVPGTVRKKVSKRKYK